MKLTLKKKTLSNIEGFNSMVTPIQNMKVFGGLGVALASTTSNGSRKCGDSGKTNTCSCACCDIA